MKEIYMLKTLDGFKTVTLEEANQQYGEMEFPYHDDKDDDLKPALQCESCRGIYEFDPNYVDCPCCNVDQRKEDTGRGLYVYRS